ncbi:ribbon-helix-helix domain-containing protein, partial [Clostridioides difficile]|uniref:ribbon-helix-helix domain-containing protein n=1 Tax=Clostridioides difficile TaxID=1496 RepID=UPI001F1D62A9
MILKDDLLRIGFDTYIENTEDELLENDKKYLNTIQEENMLKNRVRFSSSTKPDLFEKLKQLSEQTRIPLTK